MTEDRQPRSPSFFEHLSKKRVQSLLNVLTETPFFYRDDDPNLFAFLRRNFSEFQRFFDELFGWQLVVDARCARLYKPRWHNGALKPSQHDVFDLTRRDDCIAFLLVLEFHEHLLEERNASIDDPELLKFEFGELFAFARSRFAELPREAALDDDDVRRLLRGLVPTLLRYRFLREVPPSREEREGLHPDRYLYECLPALHHYDVRVLGRSALAEALTREDVPPMDTPPSGADETAPEEP